MKVLELKTQKVIEVNDGYAERMIGHGMAILPPAPRPATSKADKASDKKGDA